MQYLPCAPTEKIHFFHLKKIREITLFESFFWFVLAQTQGTRIITSVFYEKLSTNDTTT